MSTKNTYNTHGALFDGRELILYCYNDKETTLEELFLIQEKGYERAIKMQHNLFNAHKSLLTDINVFIGLN